MRRVPRSVLALAVATVLAGAGAGFAWFRHGANVSREETTRACVASATAAAQAIFSYDYRTFDQSVGRARPYVGGDIAGEDAKTTASLKPLAQSSKAIVQAQVSAIAVLDANESTVEVMVYLDQYRRNANITGEKVDQDRVLLSLRRESGTCRVVHAVAI
jgi:Mce-associated membrane protein